MSRSGHRCAAGPRWATSRNYSLAASDEGRAVEAARGKPGTELIPRRDLRPQFSSVCRSPGQRSWGTIGDVRGVFWARARSARPQACTVAHCRRPLKASPARTRSCPRPPPRTPTIPCPLHALTRARAGGTRHGLVRQLSSPPAHPQPLMPLSSPPAQSPATLPASHAATLAACHQRLYCLWCCSTCRCVSSVLLGPQPDPQPAPRCCCHGRLLLLLPPLPPPLPHPLLLLPPPPLPLPPPLLLPCCHGRGCCCRLSCASKRRWCLRSPECSASGAGAPLRFFARACSRLAAPSSRFCCCLPCFPLLQEAQQRRLLERKTPRKLAASHRRRARVAPSPACADDELA